MTYSGSVIQSYDFEAAESIDALRAWVFEAADTLRAPPWITGNHLIVTDTEDRVCLLEIETGAPAATRELDVSAQKFVSASDLILVDTKEAVYAIDAEPASWTC